MDPIIKTISGFVDPGGLAGLHQHRGHHRQVPSPHGGARRPGRGAGPEPRALRAEAVDSASQTGGGTKTVEGDGERCFKNKSRAKMMKDIAIHTNF